MIHRNTETLKHIREEPMVSNSFIRKYTNPSTNQRQNPLLWRQGSNFAAVSLFVGLP